MQHKVKQTDELLNKLKQIDARQVKMEQKLDELLGEIDYLNRAIFERYNTEIEYR